MSSYVTFKNRLLLTTLKKNTYLNIIIKEHIIFTILYYDKLICNVIHMLSNIDYHMVIDFYTIIFHVHFFLL